MKSLKILSCVFASIISCAFFTPLLHAQTIPQPGENFTAITDNGMWTWYGEPKAVYYEGTHRRTYIGWNTNISSGAQYVGYYDHDTKTTASVELPRHYPADDHNHPSVIVRPDGRIMIFHTGHDGKEISEYISKQPEDISALDTFTVTIEDWCCYPDVSFLSKEGTQGRYYLFFRDSLQEPHFRTSDDWGKTWAKEQWLYTNNPHGYKPYFKCASNGVDEIHMDIERENRAGGGSIPTYYMKYKNGAFYQASGKLIATIDQLPIVNTVLDTVIMPGNYGGGGTVWDIMYDANDNPCILYDMFFANNAIHVYWYLRWTGSYWFKRPLVNSGANDGVSGQQFCGGFTFDHENPNVIYMSRQSVKPSATPFNLADTSFANYKKISTADFVTVNTQFEIDKWTTADGGLTWDSVAITRGSANKNLRPCVPRGHKDNMNINLIWLDGTCTSMGGDGYNMAVRMYPTDRADAMAAPVIPAKLVSRDIAISPRGITVTLLRPAASSLRVYTLNGTLAADLTPLLRGMAAGIGILPLSALKLGNGTYVAKLDNGNSTAERNVVIIR
ncbi:MAG TPA: BNR-4 repeat-containing protein [Chitinivibrionales bacterium]|nr:BNR-4 repeat-containing protein [Chitinivibrionales bacterium]